MSRVPLTCLALISPGFLWAYLDYRVWPWDQAQYAEVTLRTSAAFSEALLAGVASMGVLLPQRPPGLTWLGAAFAPLAEVFGRPEPALLCATLACQLGTLVASYWSAYLISRSRLTALAVVAFVASTPIFIAMNHLYLVEPLQTFAVALSFWLALCARDMPKIALFAALCGVTAVAMAAKSTSPLYCGLPLLLAASALMGRRAVATPELPRGFRVPLVLLALAGLALVANWYATNFDAMLIHARESTLGSVVVDYGTRANFAAKLAYWASAFSSALLFPSYFLLAAATLGACAVAVLRKRPGSSAAGIPPRDRVPCASAGLVAAAAAAHLAVTFVTYSLQINEDTRFLQPLLPATAVLMAWLCSRRWQPAASAILLATALAQFLLVYGYALGWSPKAPNQPWLSAVERDDTRRRQLQMIVDLTCDGTKPHEVSLVGVQYPWLSAASANFFAVVGQRGQPVCQYAALTYGVEDADATLRWLPKAAPKYFITLTPENLPSPPDFLNVYSAEALSRVERAELWEHMRTIDDTILIFRSKRYQ